MIKQLDRVFEFVEKKGLLKELEEHLSQAETQQPDRFARLKSLVGAKAEKGKSYQPYILKVFETEDNLTGQEVLNEVNALLEAEGQGDKIAFNKINSLLNKHLLDPSKDSEGKEVPAKLKKDGEGKTARYSKIEAKPVKKVTR